MLTETAYTPHTEQTLVEWCIYLNASEAQLLWTNDKYREDLMAACEVFDHSCRPVEIAC